MAIILANEERGKVWWGDLLSWVRHKKETVLLPLDIVVYEHVTWNGSYLLAKTHGGQNHTEMVPEILIIPWIMPYSLEQIFFYGRQRRSITFKPDGLEFSIFVFQVILMIQFTNLTYHQNQKGLFSHWIHTSRSLYSIPLSLILLSSWEITDYKSLWKYKEPRITKTVLRMNKVRGLRQPYVRSYFNHHGLRTQVGKYTSGTEQRVHKRHKHTQLFDLWSVTLHCNLLRWSFE